MSIRLFYQKLHYDFYYVLYFSSSNETYPIYVVLLHEVGHVLKLKHLPHPHTVMYGFFNRLNNKLTDIDIKYAQQIWGKREKIERIKSTKSRQNSYGITTTSTSITKQQYKNVTVIIIGIVSIFITIIISVLILVSLLCYRRKYYMQVSLQERN